MHVLNCLQQLLSLLVGHQAVRAEIKHCIEEWAIVLVMAVLPGMAVPHSRESGLVEAARQLPTDTGQSVIHIDCKSA